MEIGGFIMKLKKLFLVMAIFLSALCGYQFFSNNVAKADSVGSSYQMIAHGYDWGPAIDKVIIVSGTPIEGQDLNADTFDVNSSNETIASTPREVTKAYLSDNQGNQVDGRSSRYITLDLKVHPDTTIADPFTFSMTTMLNTQTKVQFQITQKNPLYTNSNKKVTDIAPTAKTTDVQYPELSKFSKNYQFSYSDKHFGPQSLQYTSYQAPTTKKHALVIWLHGMGEGYSDPKPISLLGNKVVTLAQPKVQSYFENGADVLVPQAKTFWLDTRKTDYSNRNSMGAEGVGTNLYNNTTQDGLEQRSRYEDALTALIQSYVTAHPNVDRSKIYIGGCSNGGYMALRMMVKDPTKFSAAFPISLAYLDKNISDSQISKIKDSAIWFTQAKNDSTVDPTQTTVPTYQRLINAGASDVHFTYLDDVHDQTGLFNGTDGQPYQYAGHWSWIDVLDDYPAKDYDGTQSQTNGQDTTVFSWLATHTKATSWK